MSNGIGKAARNAFLTGLEIGGVKCDAGGQLRKAVKSKKAGQTKFLFAEEFALKAGESIREIASESYFTVIDMEPIAQADTFLYFEVTTTRNV